MLNENLKAARQRRRLSQEDLARQLHVTRQTVSKWERGLSVPDADLLARASEALDVSVAELLGGPFPTGERPDAADSDALARELANLNLQMGERTRQASRTQRLVVGVLAGLALVLVALLALSAAVGAVSFSSFEQLTEATVEPLPDPAPDGAFAG